MANFEILGVETYRGKLELDEKLVHSPFPRVSGIASWRAHRGLVNGNGMEGDLPGVFLKLSPQSEDVHFLFCRNGVHAHPAVNSQWVLSDESDRVLSVRSPIAGIRTIQLKLGFSQEEIGKSFKLFFPYAESYDFLGKMETSGKLEMCVYQRPESFYVSFGDSITQGYNASHYLKSYAYLVSRGLEFPHLNLGFGSRQLVPTDPLNPVLDRASWITVLIGVNDSLQGKPLERYQEEARVFYGNIRKRFPQTPLCWVEPFILPTFPGFDVEQKKGPEVVGRVNACRKFLQEWIPTLNDPKLVLLSTEFMEKKELLFDSIHPQDEAHERLALSMVEKIKTLS